MSKLISRTDQDVGKGAIDRPDDFFQPRAWRHEEIAGGPIQVIWKEKNPAKGEFVTYPKRHQGKQSSCVTYVLAKQLTVDEFSENGVWRELSPHSLYPYVVQPGGGSNSFQATKLVSKQGMTLESLFKSDGLSEAEISVDNGYAYDARQVALVYKPQSFVQASSDFDTIAGIIQNHRDQGIKKVVGVTVIGQNNGTWIGSAFPIKPNNPNDPNIWYHRICITDFGLINGKKALALDNSWGEIPGFKGQQFLFEDYQPFMYGAIYTLNQPDNWQQLGISSVIPPKHQWYTNLTVGSKGSDVTALQIALQSMGMFPISTIVKPTGAFYGITKKGVELFQASMALPVTGIVDEATRVKLNTIFKG